MNKEKAPRVSKRRVKEHLRKNEKLAKVYNIDFENLDLDIDELKTQLNNKLSLKEFIFFLHSSRMSNLKSALSTKKKKPTKKQLKTKTSKRSKHSTQ